MARLATSFGGASSRAPCGARISVANGVGFVGNDKVLQAFDAKTGDLLYYRDNAGTLAGVITVANGRVAYGEGLSWTRGSRAAR